MVGVVPLEGDFHDDVVLGVLDVDGELVENHLVAVQVLHEGADATGIEEVVAIAGTLIGHPDVDALVEVAQLPQALAQGLEGELQLEVENLRIGLEAHPAATAGGGAHDRQGGVGLALAEGHVMLLALAPDGEPELLGERVHAGRRPRRGDRRRSCRSCRRISHRHGGRS